MDGVIREVNLGNAVSREGVGEWVGRRWSETVSSVGSDRVIRMVADARANGVSDFRQVTQCFPSGLELPIEYNAVRLGGRAGLIAVGKSVAAVVGVQSRLIAAQHVREQDAWRLRDVGTHYRQLFESSDAPILLLGADDLHIIDANPAAIRAGALDSGRDFPSAVSLQDRASFRAMMARVSEHGRSPGILLHLGASSAPWLVRASLAPSEPETAFLIQLAQAAEAPSVRNDALSFDDLMERLPDGFALIDVAGIVLHANRAFLDLVQAAAPAFVIGQPIGRWLSRPGADAAVLMSNVRRHRVVRSFSTSIQGEFGAEAEVEISAAPDADTEPHHIGLVVRDVSRRLSTDPSRQSIPSTDRLVGPLADLTDQIGRVPLLRLVRDAGGLIERHCIEGALERSEGNRTAAAELLGLSRQSLYTKLSRYGMAASTEIKSSGD